MQITKLGHSCVNVVDEDANILIDPGTFSAGFEQLTGLTAVLITHQHADHVDTARLPALLAANPDARVFSDPETATQLAAIGVAATAVSDGDEFDVGTSVTVHGRDHAVIHRDIPMITNAGYLIGGRLLHPGDALFVPGVPVEILALPTSAPWMAVKEAIDFYRDIAPQKAFGIHEFTVRPSAVGMYYDRLKTLGPQGSQWFNIDSGEPVEV